MFEELRQQAYGEPTQSKYEGVPEMSPSERRAFEKDTDHELWKRSLKVTDQLYRKRLK